MAKISGGTSAPSVSFKDMKPGTVVGGVITDLSERQDTSYDDDAPLFWHGSKKKDIDNGRPVLYWVATLRQDDGEEVALHIKGGVYQALAEAKITEILEGGTLKLKFKGKEKIPNSKFEKNTFVVKYEEPPAKSASIGDDTADAEDDMPF